MRNQLITLISNSLTQGWEAGALVDLQKGSLRARMARRQPSPFPLSTLFPHGAVPQGPSTPWRGGGGVGGGGVRAGDEACAEPCSVGPAAAAALYL